MTKKDIDALGEIVGEKNVLTSPEDKICYGYDATRLEFMPECIVLADSKEQISSILIFANKKGIPVTPRGAATGLSGGSLPVNGGIVLVMVRMNKVYEVNKVDLLIDAQAGAITVDIDKKASKHGLFYPPDPGSLKSSTIGGNIAENAGGLRGLKYGVTMDYVNSLEVVLPTGEIVNIGKNTVKSVTGYNLLDLMIGSEGTLGIITKASLNLLPIPDARASIVASFDTLVDAAKTVRDIVGHGIITSTLEITDKVTINAIEDYLGLGLDRGLGAMLFIEVDGHSSEVKDQAKLIKSVCKENKAKDTREASSDEEREELWSARRAALSSLARVRPSTILEDATVSRSRIVDFVDMVGRIAEKYDLKIGTFGHAGDGNLHPTILTDLRDKKEEEKVEKAIEELFFETLKMDGTLSGEHGIGITKAKFLKDEIGQELFDISKKIKSVFDPNNILNPGKMFIE